MTRHRRHLVDSRSRERAACGLRDPELTTTRTSEVTCESCQRTLAMADRELREQQRRRRRNRNP